MAENKTSQTLGGFLRQERERRGITIEQVASATKINIRSLHSLEADLFSELPAKPFVRGFVISYVRFLGLESKEVLTRFGDYLDSKTVERPTREVGHTGYAFEKREGGDQSRAILWAVMAGFIVLGGVLILVLKPSFKHHRANRFEKLRSVQSGVPVVVQSMIPSAVPPLMSLASNVPVQVEQGVLVIPSTEPLAPVEKIQSPVPQLSPWVQHLPSPGPSMSPLPLSSPRPLPSLRPDPLKSGADLLQSEVQFKVVFKALEDVWVKYRVDEKGSMQFPLRKDRVLVLRAKEQVIFQTSDPQAVSFNLNNRGFKVLSNEKNSAKRRGVLTFVLPLELLETIQEPFPNERPVPQYPPPTSRTATPSPTAIQ